MSRYNYDNELTEQEENLRRDALMVISDKVAAIKDLIKECEALAKEAGVSFDLDLGQSNYFDGETGYWESSSSNC